MISNSTLQLIFKKLRQVKCWYCIKKEFLQLYGKATIMLLSLPTTELCEARFLLHTSTKATYGSKNAEKV